MITSRKLWEATLVELNKENAPKLLLADFEYFINKAIHQYINKKYSIYDINLLTTDDLSVLKSVAKIEVLLNTNNTLDKLLGDSYQFDLPKDYLHLLNCICEFEIVKPFKCEEANKVVHYKANRLTSDLYGEIINNYYMLPTYKRPYYFINNINNTSGEIPNTNIGEIDVENNPVYSNRGKDLIINGQRVFINVPERQQHIRYGNPTNVRMEIRCGKNKNIKLKSIYIDYLRNPLYVKLTLEELDSVKDISQVIEFQDYVCNEIINELVHTVMENISDPRLQTHIPVSLSIVNPTQQLTK